MERLNSEPGGCLRWIAVMLLFFIFIGTAPASAEELPDCLHVYVNVSNELGPRFSDSANGSYYMKFDGGGLNALHLTTDTAVPKGQVTTSNDQSGVFYITDTGGRGYSDNTILMFAVNGTVPDDFALTIRASGYVWEPVAVVNTLPLLGDIGHIDGTMEETFTKEDLLYGPQTWKPAGNNLPKAYPIYFEQDTADTGNPFQLMFIDLKAGPISKATGLASASDLTDCGAVKVEYAFENLETFAAFNAYVWCNQSNQGQGISWTNQVSGSGSSVYQVVGIPPELTSISVSPETAEVTESEGQQFAATALDQNDRTMSDIAFAWSSNDETVGTVNDTGYFTALTAGTTTITASCEAVSGTATVIVTGQGQSGGLLNSSWPMIGYDLRHTGQSPYSGPEFPTKKWSYSAAGFLLVQPVIDQNGTIYVGSRDKKLHAVNPDGSLKWTYLAANQIYSAAAIDSEGTVYFGSRDMKIYALNSDGTLKWTFTTGGVVSSAPAIGADGTIYAGSADMKIYALNPDGTEKWSYTTGGAVNAAPAIGTDGTIYAGSGDANIYALNSDGTLKWSYTAGGSVNGASAIGIDGTIYSGCADGSLYALNADGTLKWSYATGGSVADPGIGPDGTIYAGSASKTINAMNPDGTLKWSYQTAGTVTMAPAIDADGTVYIASSDRNDRNLYAIRSDGTLKWKFIAPSPRYFSTPSISGDGTIYIGATDSKLYAIGATDSPEIISIVIDPAEVEITKGLVQQFTALGSDAAGNVFANLPFNWLTTNETVGTVNATGIFTALEPGTTMLTVTYGAVNGTTNVTVIPPVPVMKAISVSPAEKTLFVGDVRQFNATGLDQFGEPMEGIAFNWTSSNTSVGTVDSTGNFTALVAGTTCLTATNGTVSGNASVTVVDSSMVAAITVSPSSVSVTEGDGVQFNATAYDQYNAAVDGLTFTWTSSDTSVGTINATGYFTSLAYGHTDITASIGAVNATSSVTVLPISPLTWYVDASGGANFTTIQAAVDAAFDGDTIIVRDGTYNETLTLAKPLTLRSANGPETTNVVSTSKYGITVSANNTMVSGFSLSGSGSYGIYSRSNSMCTFADNVITDKKIGIDVLFVSGMRIDGNIITDLQTYGSCIILQNTIDSVISNNTCSGGGQRGIYTTTDCSNNVITGNFISGNQYGFVLMGCKNSRFDRNIVMDNEYAFFMTFDSVIGNTFFANSFVNDSTLFGTSLKVANTWNSPEPVTYTYNGATYTGMIGNYWGAGFPIDDVDGNGIGDTGVSLFTDNTDSYPLVLPAEAYFGEPYGDIPVPATVEIVPSSVVLPGETTQQFSGTVYDQNGNVMKGASFRWTSSDERVGPISSGGLFSAEYAGTTTITGQSYLVRGTAEAVVNKTVLETVWTDPCESTDGWTLFNTALQDGVVYKGSYSIGTPAIAGDAYAERSIDFPDGAAQFRFRVYRDSATNGVGTYSWLKAFIDNETVETLPVGQFKGPWNTYSINITGYETGNHTFRIETHFDPGTFSGRAIGFYVDQLEVRIDPAAVMPAVSSVMVTPASVNLTTGTTQQFNATGYDQYETAMEGLSFTWMSSNETVGTITPAGVFTAVSPGSATISASSGGISGTADVMVSLPAPALTTIVLDPVSASITVGDGQQFNATGYDQYETAMADIPFTWVSSNETVGTITPAGVFTAVSPGSAIISATSGAISGTADVTVSLPAPELTTIVLDPVSVSIEAGDGQQFTATAYDQYDDAMEGFSFTWSSSGTTVGTIDVTGYFTAHRAGTTTITASNGDVSGTATVTVAPPHGDQKQDSPLNVPGCNISDKGDGTREVIVNLTATNATVNGNAIKIDEETFTLIIETEGAPTVGNGTANGTVAGISLTTAPVSTTFGTLGNVTASLMANLTGIPSGAALETTISENISVAAQSAFQIAATADGLNLDAVAYTMNIVKTNLANGQDISDATIRMSVSPAWVAANGGYDSIKIIRFAEDGTKEVLTTIYLGFDGELDQFEAFSPNGLSIFGLSAASAASVAPSGSGSSSSSGGSSSSTSTARCDGINAGETGVFVMDMTAITEIDVKAGMNIPKMMLTAEKVGKPSTIDAAPHEVYQYVQVTSYLAPEDGMEMATLKFSVDKAWLDSLGAGVSDVLMYHYDEATETWNLLSTVPCGEDGTCYTFFADTPSFSLFAISAEKGTASAAPDTPEDVTQPVAESGNTPAAGAQSPADTQTPVTTTGGNTTVIVILVVVAIIAVCGVVYWKKTSGKK